MARQATLDYIKSLGHAELAEFFDEALQHLQEGSLPDGLTVFRLATTSTAGSGLGPSQCFMRLACARWPTLASA